MNILVLGAGGQLGYDLVAAAKAAERSVEGWDRGRLDLSNPDAIPPSLQGADFDVLVNCAAYTGVDAAESDATAAFALNARAVERMAEVCRVSGRRLVHVSTDYVFSGETERPYAPDDPPGPLNVYGASKLAGEALARRAHPSGTVVVRTSALFGLAGARPGGGGNFVETMIRAGTERGHLRVVDDIVMAPTSSADLARGLLGLLDTDPSPGVYHLTNAGHVSWYEFARAILDRAGVAARLDPVPSADYPTPARRPRFTVLETLSATRRIGGELPHWTDALDRYIAARVVAAPQDRADDVDRN